MNTYAYKVTNLVRDADGIVVTVNFEITVSDGTDSFTHSFTCGINNQPVTPTPFEELTEAQVIEWVKASAGEDSQFEKSADSELAAYKLRTANPVMTAGVPW